jgi:hypothetical protein
LLEQAIAIDRHYGPALSWVALCHLRLVIDGWAEEPETSRRKTSQLARLALDVGENDPGILVNAAFVLAYLGEDVGAAYFVKRQFHEAASKLLLSIQDHPGFPSSYRFLAACYAHDLTRARRPRNISRIRIAVALQRATDQAGRRAPFWEADHIAWARLNGKIHLGGPAGKQAGLQIRRARLDRDTPTQQEQGRKNSAPPQQPHDAPKQRVPLARVARVAPTARQPTFGDRLDHHCYRAYCLSGTKRRSDPR